MIFNKYLANLLCQIKEKGYVTTKTQTVYVSTLGFYIAMKWLRDHDLIKCDGMDENNFKKWSLNERGEELVEHLIKIMELVK